MDASPGGLTAFLSAECTARKTDPFRFEKPRHLAQVMSAVLKLLEDSANSSKIAAVSNLDCIILSGASWEILDSLGYFDVTFDAVFRMVHFQDVELLNHAYPTLLTILRTRATGEKKVSEPRYGQLEQADQLLLQSLKHITLFSDGKVRDCVVENTVNLLRYLGIRSAKFFPRLLGITETMIRMPSQQLSALCLLTAAAHSCWPVFPNHLDRIVLQLMKTVLLENESTDPEISEKVKEMFVILNGIDSGAVAIFVNSCLQKHSFPCEFRVKMSGFLEGDLVSSTLALCND